MSIDSNIKEVTTFKNNLIELTKIVNEIFKSDKGMLIEEEVALIKLYNKSFSIYGKLDNLTKEMVTMNKIMKKWK